MIEDALDSIKTARYQVGTFSHFSEEVDSFLDGLRNWTERWEVFFSDRRHVVMIAAAFMASIIMVNYLRGWFASRFHWRKKRR